MRILDIASLQYTISIIRDISFLYDAKVIDNRSKPLTSLAKSREVKPDTNKMGDLGMKTPGIEVRQHTIDA